MLVLGISAYYHDSAVAIVRDGQILAAAQEERFSRRKHDARFPQRALAQCLQWARVGLADFDFIAFYDKPFLKFERLLETYLTSAPRGFRSFAVAMPIWLREKLFLKSLLLKELRRVGGVKVDPQRLLFAEHHISHAASAFFASPFRKAAILTMDGVGEWTTTSWAYGEDNRIEVHQELHFPHSLGLLYSSFTYYLGFKVNSGEYKVMGLAPYGEPKYAGRIYEHLLDLKPDGTFRLNLDYFDYCTGFTMTNGRFAELFGGPPRIAEGHLERRHLDLAASVQAVTEEVVLRLTDTIARQAGAANLCLAGGVALNCVANGKVWKRGRFKGLWIQPASGDAGGALGAALAAYHIHAGQPRLACAGDTMQRALLGPEFLQAEIEQRLKAAGAHFTVCSEESLIEWAARDLADGLALGWFQGRMEFGPRALGSRSILADARSAQMQSVLNRKIKFRESFRPFAPAVLREDVADWFELDADSPYMLLVAEVKAERRRALNEQEQVLSGLEKLKVARSEIPAVTHVDHSARIQTVDEHSNRLFYALLKQFKTLTGCPVLVNTSFNVRGEPIVGTPEDAFRCFMGTQLDRLAVGRCYLRKEDQLDSSAPSSASPGKNQ